MLIGESWGTDEQKGGYIIGEMDTSLEEGGGGGTIEKISWLSAMRGWE